VQIARAESLRATVLSPPSQKTASPDISVIVKVTVPVGTSDEAGTAEFGTPVTMALRDTWLPGLAGGNT